MLSDGFGGFGAELGVVMVVVGVLDEGLARIGDMVLELDCGDVNVAGI